MVWLDAVSSLSGLVLLTLWMVQNGLALIAVLLLLRFMVYYLVTIVYHPLVRDITEIIAQELLVVLQQVVWITRKLVSWISWAVPRLVGLSHHLVLVHGPRMVGLCHHLGTRLFGLCHLLLVQPRRPSGLMPKSTSSETTIDKPERTTSPETTAIVTPESTVVTLPESTVIASPKTESAVDVMSDDDALVEDLLGDISDNDADDSDFDTRPASCELVGLCHGSSKSAINKSVIVPVVPAVPAVTVVPVVPAVTIVPVVTADHAVLADPAVTVTAVPAAPVLNSSTFVEDLYDAIGDITMMREYLLAAGLPPKVATKYLMELVVPKKPVVIKVGMLLREDHRKKVCAASWESPTPVYPTYSRPIRGIRKSVPACSLPVPASTRPRSTLSQVVTVPLVCPPLLGKDDDNDESEVDDLIPQTPSSSLSLLLASPPAPSHDTPDVFRTPAPAPSLAEGYDTPDCFRTPAWAKFPAPEAIPYNRVIFPTMIFSTVTSPTPTSASTIMSCRPSRFPVMAIPYNKVIFPTSAAASTFMSCPNMPIRDDAEGLHWRCHPSGDIIMGREPRGWAPFGWDGPDGDIVMGG